jgi:hypothetical protein
VPSAKKPLVAEPFFALGVDDQREVLEIARERTGRPAHLLEKDVWVVWALNALFSSPLASDLMFKGGTSLSKAYKIIDRFSEDIDLTYDIRKLIPDLVEDGSALPGSRSKASKGTKAVGDRLPEWIDAQVRPAQEEALARDHLEVKLEIGGADHDKLLLHYPARKLGTGYVAPVVTLEFGGRATGEPHQVMQVACDMAGHVDDVLFPVASWQVMSVARTFWEKATAAHVYCAQARIRSERYARHWHDLAAIGRSPHFTAAIADRAVAKAVAEHKSLFFIEKDAEGTVVDYFTATSGRLQIVPEGAARDALAADYASMRADDILVGDALPFDALMKACSSVAQSANAAATSN